MFNAVITSIDLDDTGPGFTSNDAHYADGLQTSGSTGEISIYYVEQAPSKYVEAYTGNISTKTGTWANEAYRTVSFDSEPTSILTWLNKNATKLA